MTYRVDAYTTTLFTTSTAASLSRIKRLYKIDTFDDRAKDSLALCDCDPITGSKIVTGQAKLDQFVFAIHDLGGHGSYCYHPFPNSLIRTEFGVPLS
jgi:hypothetical protein